MRRLMMILGLLVVCCVACGVVAAVATYFMEQERAEVREAYGEDVAVLCDPPSGGTASASNLPAAEGGMQVLILGQGDELKHAYHDSLPDDLRADDAAELDVVACVAEQEEQVESCPYYDLADDTKLIGTINRVQKNINVILLNPEGNLRISEFQVKGGAPQLCPDEVELREGSTTKYEGADVTYNDFEIALRGALGTE